MSEHTSQPAAVRSDLDDADAAALADLRAIVTAANHIPDPLTWEQLQAHRAALFADLDQPAPIDYPPRTA